MRRVRGQRGLSLVEVTIILLVLMLLTSVLAPSIWDFVHDAQWVKVKEDCEAIGISFSRLVRDVGPCVRASAATGCTLANRVDTLVSDGAATVPGLGTAFSSSYMASTNWATSPNATNTDSMERQFVLNSPNYATPMALFPTRYPVGPQFGLGWRGAYLAPPIGPDPWGSRYYVNAGFFAVAITATSSSDEGAPGHSWERDVVCLSPGPDQVISTPFASPSALTTSMYGTQRSGDDFVFVISGSSR